MAQEDYGFFLIAACGSAFRPVIEWVEDQDNVITNEALDRLFGPIGAEPIENVQEMSEQVHIALLALKVQASILFLDRHQQVWKR